MDWESKNGNKYRNAYKKEHYDRYSLMLPKGKKIEYMNLAAKRGIKLNELINNLLEQTLRQDDSKQNSR